MEASSGSRVTKGLIAALVLFVILVLVVPLGVTFLLKPKAREKVVELLEKRFDRVELERLDIRFRPGLNLLPRISATGSGLSVSLPDREDAPPFITMNEFEVDLGLLGVLADPIRVRSLRLDELRIQIPPREKGEKKERRLEGRTAAGLRDR